MATEAGTLLAISLASVLFTTVPTMATPSTEPSCPRYLTALVPMPSCVRGSAFCAAIVSTEKNEPKPMPAITMNMIASKRLVVGVIVINRNTPTVMTSALRMVMSW